MNVLYPEEMIRRAKFLGDGRVFGCERPILPTATCANCGDLGVIFAFEVAAGPFTYHPDTRADQVAHWFDEKKAYFVGQFLTGACPVCAGSKQAYWLASNCGLTGDELDIRLDAFTPMEGKEPARALAGKLLGLSPHPIGFVTLYGGYGVGKTTLLKALINGFRIVNIPSVYTRMSDMLNDFREGFTNPKDAIKAVVDRYASYRVLAIDEIDRVNLTAWVMEIMPAFLDARYEASKTSLTIMATNQNPETFPEALQYLASRMTSGVVLEVGGVDVRKGQGIVAKRELLDWTR
jgi:hypothetical protein